MKNCSIFCPIIAIYEEHRCASRTRRTTRANANARHGDGNTWGLRNFWYWPRNTATRSADAIVQDFPGYFYTKQHVARMAKFNEEFPSVSIFPSSPAPLSFLLFCQYTLALWSDEKGFCNLVCDSTKPGKLWPGGIALTLFSELFFMHHGGLSAWLVTVSFWWGFRSCCVQWMLGFLRISRN